MDGDEGNDFTDSDQIEEWVAIAERVVALSLWSTQELSTLIARLRVDTGRRCRETIGPKPPATARESVLRLVELDDPNPN